MTLVFVRYPVNRIIQIVDNPLMCAPIYMCSQLKGKSFFDHVQIVEFPNFFFVFILF